MHAWFDGNCDAGSWAMTLVGLRGVVNDAVAAYFRSATRAAGFVSRWCAGSQVAVSGGRSGCARTDRRPA
jgi:hypothetical protein